MELLARTCKSERMNVERLLARAFTILGAVFWVVMIVAASTKQHYALMEYSGADILNAAETAVLPLLLAIAVFVLGLFYERLTALVLLLVAVAVAAYGLLAGWETGVWMYVMLVVVAPVLIAALLYWLAGRMQQICLLEEQVSG